MIEVKQISKSFGETKAVKSISFKVPEGETLILLGTSGCGKTTTLKMINRLIAPDSGAVFIDGKDTTNIQPEQLRLGIGYVLQNHGLFPHYTVAQNIAIVPDLLKWTAKTTKRRTDELLEKLHLSPSLKTKYPHQLSGGQQQRVGLARALMTRPPILLMDEPLGALDPITRENIRKEFLTLDELQGKTTIMVTHDVQEAFELGDKICLMDKGEILQIGSPQELLQQPSNQKVSNFFKGQHLALTLKTIAIKEVWPFLNSIREETITAPAHLAAENIWNTLEVLALQKQLNIVWQGQQKTISTLSLMQALENYKNRTNGRHQ